MRIIVVIIYIINYYPYELFTKLSEYSINELYAITFLNYYFLLLFLGRYYYKP